MRRRKPLHPAVLHVGPIRELRPFALHLANANMRVATQTPLGHLMDVQMQKRMVAAGPIGPLSERGVTRLQSFSLLNRNSIRLRPRSSLIGLPRAFRPGMNGVIPLCFMPSVIPSASSPRLASNALASVKPASRGAALV